MWNHPLSLCWMTPHLQSSCLHMSYAELACRISSLTFEFHMFFARSMAIIPAWSQVSCGAR
jgi:hypothetical protein